MTIDELRTSFESSTKERKDSKSNESDDNQDKEDHLSKVSEESAYDEDEEDLYQIPNKGQEASNPKEITDTNDEDEGNK